MKPFFKQGRWIGGAITALMLCIAVALTGCSRQPVGEESGQPGNTGLTSASAQTGDTVSATTTTAFKNDDVLSDDTQGDGEDFSDLFGGDSTTTTAQATNQNTTVAANGSTTAKTPAAATTTVAKGTTASNNGGTTVGTKGTTSTKGTNATPTVTTTTASLEVGEDPDSSYGKLQ